MVRGRQRGTRLWACVEDYYVKTLAACGGPESGCSVDKHVGARELDKAKAALRNDFSLVLITEWLGAEGQKMLMANALCFAWPPPKLMVPRGISRGELRSIPEFTPKRYSGQGVPAGWADGISAELIRRLRKENAVDHELFIWAAELVHGRIQRIAGHVLASQLPKLNLTENLIGL